MQRSLKVTAGSALMFILSACAQPADVSLPAGPGEPGSGASSGSKRITLAITTEPPSLYYSLIPSAVRGGPGALAELIHPGLTVFDHEGRLRPALAEVVPSVENGQWKVFPDGRMETVWTIKPGVQWHDGTPLTAADLQFTVRVMQDKELALFRDRLYDDIESAEVRDERTIAVTWKQPSIEADELFTYARAVPIPRHIVEPAYTEAKATFSELPAWTEEFIGTGPFRLQEWERGSHLVLGANPDYVLGRPKLDEIRVRFITDGNTLISNLLSGEIDLTLRQAISADQAIQVRDQWRYGTVHISTDGWAVVYPQHLNPSLPLITNVQFRKALIQGVDRQQLADTLMSGVVPIAEGPLSPGSREYEATKGGIVRYGYDPRRAAQLIEGLGYTKGGDGIYQDAAGQRLAFETRATAQRDIHVKTLFPLVDNWKALGLDISTQVIPAAQATDREEQATFPGFQVLRQPSGLARLTAYHTSEARTAERRFTGSNNGRYMNAELDALIDRFLVTIPFAERMQTGTQIVHHITDQLPVIPLFHDASSMLVHNRLINVTPLSGAEEGRPGWNAHLWDVRAP
jgi:peptide/nickel transport system substrate-binding protein